MASNPNVKAYMLGGQQFAKVGERVPRCYKQTNIGLPDGCQYTDTKRCFHHSIEMKAMQPFSLVEVGKPN